MTFEAYLKTFEDILAGNITAEPYNEEDILHYTKMNSSRLHRWLKTGKISEELKSALEKIDQPQTWVLITEPWCGDAAHAVPFIYMLSQLNPLITLSIQLRDSESEIDTYLTNGGKAIPILIVRDAAGKDLWVWGPRPKAAQELFVEAKEKGMDMEEIKLMFQHWYNEDKGVQLQQEFLAHFKA